MLAIIVAFVLWVITIAEYTKITKITHCETVEYIGTDDTAAPDYMKQCEKKYSDYQCVCTDNSNSFCSPYSLNFFDSCKRVLGVYYYEVACSIVLLTLSMFVLVLYVLLCYVSMCFLSSTPVTMPEVQEGSRLGRFVSIFKRKKKDSEEPTETEIGATAEQKPISETATVVKPLSKVSRAVSFLTGGLLRKKESAVQPTVTADGADSDEEEGSAKKSEGKVRVKPPPKPVDPMQLLLQQGTHSIKCT